MTTDTAPATFSPEDLVTIREAMALAQVTRRTIYNWLRSGKLTFVRTAGGQVRILNTSLFRDGSVPVAPAAPVTR